MSELGRVPLTRDESRELDRQHAMAIPADDVIDHLEIMAYDLDQIRNATEALMEREDVYQEDYEIAKYISDGLQIWSELIFDREEDK